jgi:hypothetical protein
MERGRGRVNRAGFNPADSVRSIVTGCGTVIIVPIVVVVMNPVNLFQQRV